MPTTRVKVGVHPFLAYTELSTLLCVPGDDCSSHISLSRGTSILWAVSTGAGLQNICCSLSSLALYNVRCRLQPYIYEVSNMSNNPASLEGRAAWPLGNAIPMICRLLIQAAFINGLQHASVPPKDLTSSLSVH